MLWVVRYVFSRHLDVSNVIDCRKMTPVKMTFAKFLGWGARKKFGAAAPVDTCLLF